MWIATGTLFMTTLVFALLFARQRRAAQRNARALTAAIEQHRLHTAKMDAIVAGMPDGILVVDADLRVVEWNRHFPEFAGVPEEMLREGLDLADVLRAQAAAGEFGPVDSDAEVERRMALLRAGVSVGTIERRRPNGRVLELRRSPMSGGGFVTLYSDITERREAEEQLRQAQKMEAVGHLTGGMAHDFNNLLMVITGNLELALQALGRSDLVGADRRVRTAQAGTRRAATLTQRLLAFARKQTLEPQAVDANKVVAEMSELLRHSIGAEVDLETVLAGGLWEAIVDPHEFRERADKPRPQRQGRDAGRRQTHRRDRKYSPGRVVCGPPHGGQTRPICHGGRKRFRDRDDAAGGRTSV